MLEPAYQADVVVVGAGVAGLSAAHRLTGAGVTTVVLEAAPYAGGRMSTEKIDGFRLDRIGQLLSTAFPELGRTPGLDALVLRPFAPGVLLHSDGRHHRAGAQAGAGGARGALHVVRALAGAPRGSGLAWGTGVARGAGAARSSLPRPSGALRAAGAAWPPGVARPAVLPRQRVGAPAGGRAGARGPVPPPRVRPGAPLGTAVDQARLGAALARLAGMPVERLLARPESPAGQALAARGLPARTVDGFLRPLLAALLCDPELTTSSRCADLALRAFATGRLCLPEGGAEVLPELLARTLPPGTVHTGVRVTSVSTNSVTTAEHGEFRCGAVLVATDARTAAELLPGLRVPEFHPVTVVHHTPDEPPGTGAALLLDADRGGPVAHTAVVSEVDPSRAPAGRTLVSSTVLGTPPAGIDTAVRMHLARLYGVPTDRWETLAIHHTAEAVPAMRAPHDLRRPVRLLAGLYVCGDHRDTSTVQGALHSAHRAARAILADLGAAGSMHSADPLPTTPKAA
ncbi:NAD(P)/FAD-dependent oxidoreductase [Streptomyces sp. NPDC018693]|uniref:NAD(P)/FAD-dependent oxidoreductase n=1 Tax=unclassified Streptomyces TaxID=2593676 RepID=UPI0037B6DC9B